MSRQRRIKKATRNVSLGSLRGGHQRQRAAISKACLSCGWPLCIGDYCFAESETAKAARHRFKSLPTDILAKLVNGWPMAKIDEIIALGMGPTKESQPCA